ncbi:hypothetical protein, partial [Frankia gtarii]|uniref:hypothetical protein n=1 Tax=Frankia gtarii TaxID=2950102 RepID=UPI0021C1D42F
RPHRNITMSSPSILGQPVRLPPDGRPLVPAATPMTDGRTSRLDEGGEAVFGHRVPAPLRPIVQLARIRSLVEPARLAQVLRSLDPPIDPNSPAWTALGAALDAYDHAEQANLDLDPARRLILAAAALLRRAEPGTPGAQP